jgi:cation diffusion facilitator family transporter
MVMKFAAFSITHSNAVLTDALESIINVIASGFAFYSIYLAALPKDENHPYGHGKIEFFSAGFEGALIAFAGIFILYRAIANFSNPTELQALPESMAIIALTIIVNTVLGYKLLSEGKKHNSLILIADGKHLLVDSISSFILLTGIFIISLTGWHIIDSILSIILAGVILYNGYLLLRKSIAGLMDEADRQTLTKIAHILKEHRKDSWIDVHNLRIQRYGADLHLDCHITLPYYYNLQQMHDQIKSFEMLLEKSFENHVEVFVHVDPCLPECCHYCRISNCPVRYESKKADVEWTVENLYKNQKHFHESDK